MILKKYIIAGTDTDVGKTVVAALITKALDAHYYKPIQSSDGQSWDSEFVEKHIQDSSRIHVSYSLQKPLSPNQAAEELETTIDLQKLELPNVKSNLVVELAGGLMVPLTNDFLQIDLIKKWNLPVILVARSTLGTINHTLLSVHLLKSYNIPIKGIVINGENHEKNTRDIKHFSNTPILCKIPFLESFDDHHTKKYQTIFKELL